MKVQLINIKSSQVMTDCSKGLQCSRECLLSRLNSLDVYTIVHMFNLMKISVYYSNYIPRVKVQYMQYAV